MSNELALRKTAALPVGTFAELLQAGELIGQCQMLGCSNKSEGFIIAATCYQEGMTFLDFSNKFDIIDGKPRKKAETMLAELRQRGGNYTIKERTPETVTVEFRYGGNSYTSSLSWRDISLEPYTRAGKDELGRAYTVNTPIERRRFKDNWSTPRRRMQMMWARCISDGVRVVCPEVTQGMYTPEEAQDFDATAPISVTPADPATPAAPIQVAPLPSAAPEIEAAAPVAPAVPLVEAGAAETTPFDSPAPTVAAPVITTPTPAPAPTVAPIVVSADESPFASMDANGSICHVKGQYEGCSWHLVPDEFCRTILAADYVEGVTDADREFIKDSLKQRGN